MAKAATLVAGRGMSPAARATASKIEKMGARRVELAEATLETLAELGYARTSLREIANNSQFSHGVLHYYFHDKFDLICCAVRHYKATCATRYDAIVAEATTAEGLLNDFCAKLAETLVAEARMHRLWYDLRSQALFEDAIRQDVVEIEESLENMIWRVGSRYAELSGKALTVSKKSLYAVFDGLFQKCLLMHMSGNKKASVQLAEEVRRVLPRVF